MRTVRILVIGDIIGKPGRKAVAALLPSLKEEFQIDFVIANGENMSGGSGITDKNLKELLSSGIDVVTGGDHLAKKKDEANYTMSAEHLLRPGNFSKNWPGQGSLIFHLKDDCKIAVVNAQGRIFLDEKLSNPFSYLNSLIPKLREETSLIIFDFHAEASSEKIAMGYFLDGKVSAVVGTHTHVPTADERILPQGTAYITDIGMTGGHDGVIGRKKESVILKFLGQPHRKFEVATEDVILHAVLVDVDIETGKALEIQRISRESR